MLIKAVTDFAELEGIKKLQEENLRKNISPEEAALEGFVSAEYSLSFLKQMHDECPSVIAKDGDLIAGYALVTTAPVGRTHALLEELFDVIDNMRFKGRLLSKSRYVVVGQLCVAKGYRGLGLVQQMYSLFGDLLRDRYDYCITDVAEDNPRSLKAHIKSGFQVIATLRYSGVSWNVVLWDWAGRKEQR